MRKQEQKSYIKTRTQHIHNPFIKAYHRSVFVCFSSNVPHLVFFSSLALAMFLANNADLQSTATMNPFFSQEEREQVLANPIAPASPDSRLHLV